MIINAFNTCAFHIGREIVQIKGASFLTGALSNLLRLPATTEPVDGTDQGVMLEVEKCAMRTWPLDVTEQDNVHIFGRMSYAFEATPEEKRLRLLLLPDAPVPEEMYWFQRDLFGLLSCFAGELMLHGSAVVAQEGKAWIFCGPSGTGKSTLCRMLMGKGYPVINDEINWLFHDVSGRLCIVNQPYWFGQSEQPFLPVERLHLIEQAPVCALVPGPSKAETFARLLAAHLSIDLKYSYLQQRCESLRQLVESRDIDVLRFNLNIDEILELLCTKPNPNDI